MDDNTDASNADPMEPVRLFSLCSWATLGITSPRVSTPIDDLTNYFHDRRTLVGPTSLNGNPRLPVAIIIAAAFSRDH